MTIPAAFRLDATYVPLKDGPGAVPIEVTDDFWQTLDQRIELHDGRLITLGHMASDWGHWECTRQGVSSCISCRARWSSSSGEQVIPLGERQAIIVPRSV